ALELNPSYARGWHVSGILRSWAGDPDTAIRHVEYSVRLSPRARVGSTANVIGGSHFLARRFNEAIAKLLIAIQGDPRFSNAYRYLAASYPHLARLDEAREVIERLRPITPLLIPDVSYLRKAEDRELFVSGLRLATGEPACPPPAVSQRSSR